MHFTDYTRTIRMFLVHTAVWVAVVCVIFATNHDTKTNSTETNTIDRDRQTPLVEIINSNVTFNTVSNIPSSPLKGFNVSDGTNVIVDSDVTDTNDINPVDSIIIDTTVTESNDTDGDILEPLLSDTNTVSTDNNTITRVIDEANIDGLMTPSQYRFLKTAFKYRLNVSLTCRM